MGESTYSNGYTWNADLVLKKIIQERGETKVIFINGMNVTNIRKHSDSVQGAFGLKYPVIDSLQFKNYENISESEGGEAEQKFDNFNKILKEHLFEFSTKQFEVKHRYLIDKHEQYIDSLVGPFPWNFSVFFNKPNKPNYNDYGITEDKFKDLYYGYKRAKRIIESPNNGFLNAPRLFTQGDKDRERLVDFLEYSGQLEELGSRLGSKPDSDLVEALVQFLYDEPQDVSKQVNNQWTDSTVSWLTQGNSNNNSVIFVPHSQGNFFVEDGLLEKSNDFTNVSNRIKVISLGSPTNYSSDSLDQKYEIALFPNGNSDPNKDDPIAKLRYNSGEFNNDYRKKLNHALKSLYWRNFGPSQIGGKLHYHDLEEDKEHGYLKRQDVKDKFSDFFYSINPRGYYFPKGVINGEGTDRGDWLQGKETNDTLNPKAGNDVVRGQGGNDRVIAGAGWDFIDGGTGTDSAEYSNWSNPITVRADSISGSDIYRITKNTYGTEDILVDIETVYGSRFKDYMYGERGKDVFHGNAGDDTLRGQGGNDKLYGGNDQDTLLGGVGNDLLDGGSGNDFLIGAQGYDTINGGSNIDTVSYLKSPRNVIVNIDEINPYLNGINNRASIAINQANPVEYFYELEPDFQIEAGKAVDGFGTADKLKNLENIIGSINNDVLIGNQKNNTIKGYLGNDLIVNTAGYDLFDGGEGNDTVSLRRDPGDVVVNLTRNFAIDAWGGRDAIVNIENIVGSDLGNDRLTGNNIANIITGGNGNDYIKGLGGNDTLHGEFGNDSIVGGLGKDSLVGNQGSDTIWGDAIGNPDAGDADLIRGGDGDDKIHAGGGDDTVFGDSGIGNDEIWGDAGNDKLHGGAGNDIIEGGTGNDLILGEDGADILRGNSGSDTVDGGKGTDLVDYVDAPSGVIVNINESQGYSSNQQNSFAPNRNYEIGAGEAKDGYGFSDSLRNLENIGGSEFADVLIGNKLKNEIRGKGDNDILVGLAGDDNLQGQDGDDVMLGGAGKDRINGGEGIDIASYRDATSSVSVSLNARSGWQGDAAGDEIVETEGLEGSNFNDYLIGDNDKNILNGIGGDDTLEGYDGDDVINGGDGSDRLVGGLGNDTQIGGLGNDVHYGELGNDKLIDLVGDNYIDAGEGNNIVIAGDGNDVIYSGPGDDVITGGNGKNTLHAGEGKNQITTGSDNDIIYGGASEDIIYAGAGDDQIFAAEGNNIIRAGAGNDTIYAGAGYDLITGGLGDDLIFAGDGDNWINGGIGNDIINSGSGKDLFILDLSDGTDTINNFQIGHDLIGLSGGLTFEQLFITQGTDNLNSSTLISDANSGNTLASLSWTSADSINSSSFTII